jgi:hypothetical protein
MHVGTAHVRSTSRAHAGTACTLVGPSYFVRLWMRAANAFASLRCSHGDPRRRPSSCSRRLRQVGSIATPNYFCNIQTKHLQHTSETAKHLQHTCETQKNTQVAIANICNMQMRHLQYTYETPETLEIYVCNIPDLLLQHPDETLITYV